jgi:hypothetical protein
MFGCAYWSAGAGDALPPEWMPPGYRVPVTIVVWGAQQPPAERPPLLKPDPRPTNESDAFKYDQRCEALAWRAADELMARSRRC